MLAWLDENHTYIASFCSVFAFLLSILLLLLVRNIRKYFELKARTPQIVAQLRKFFKELNACLDDAKKNKNEVIVLSKKLEFTLRSLRRKASADIVKTIDLMLSSIAKLKNGGPSRWNPFKKTDWSFNDEAWELYSDLQAVLQGLKEATKDSRWSQQ
jgi:hypothetical protein